MGQPVIKFTPEQPLTHQELLIDFFDLPPGVDFSVNVNGPLGQPYWATLRSGPDGHAQLFWRTQADGEYQVKGKGPDFRVSATFSVARQEGEPEGEPVADVKTVEEPAPEPEPEPKAAPKPRARRKTSAKRTTGSKAR